jgi:hypothetical protein
VRRLRRVSAAPPRLRGRRSPGPDQVLGSARSVQSGGGGGRGAPRPPQQAWNPVGRKRSERPPSSGRGAPRPPPRSRFTSARYAKVN